MPKRKCKSAKDATPASARSMPSQPPRKTAFAAVASRWQTPEEERHFNAAFDLFLAELIRQHLDPHEGT